jgi:GMP synthase (glutamine-hydrolysing)
VALQGEIAHDPVGLPCWSAMDHPMIRAPRFGLLQARNPDDPVRSEELACFIRQLGVDAQQVTPIDILVGGLDDSLFERFDALLVGGSGEYSVLDDSPVIREFIDFVGATAERGFPLFASCFGFQALALALGGEVVHDAERAEVGTFEVTLTDEGARDPLLSQLPRSFLAQEGHKDHVTRLPEGMRHLVRSERSEMQALRYGDRPVWATQFHPELREEDNRQRVMRYRAVYAKEVDRVLDTLRPTPHPGRLLSAFVAHLSAADARAA